MTARGHQDERRGELRMGNPDPINAWQPPTRRARIVSAPAGAGDGLAAWLTQIWDEQERAAKECEEVYPSPWELSDRGWMAKVQADGPAFRIVTTLEQDPAIEGWLGDRLSHLAANDPASVLARIAADRQILAAHSGVPTWPDNDLACFECSPDHSAYPCRTVRLLALPYTDRPGYQEAWRP